jgi:mRNA interferase RelE/StbE
VGSFAVRFKASAESELESLDDRLLRRIFERIESLAENPRPPGCKKLKGAANLWRIRIGAYRVVYAVDDTNRLVEVRRVRHRREAYE